MPEQTKIKLAEDNDSSENNLTMEDHRIPDGLHVSSGIINIWHCAINDKERKDYDSVETPMLLLFARSG